MHNVYLVLVFWATIGLVVCASGHVVMWYIRRTKHAKWGPLSVALEKELTRKDNQGWWASGRDIGLYMVIWPIMLIFMYQVLTMREEDKDQWKMVLDDVEEERTRREND